jgi:hypothetical protein
MEPGTGRVWVGCGSLCCSASSCSAFRRVASKMPQPFMWGLSISKAPLQASTSSTTEPPIFGPLVAGLMVGAFGGSFNNVTAFMTCFALLSILAMILGRETKGAGLPR